MSNLDEVVTFPQLNRPAPNFNAKTTHGMKSLEDYKGKWLVLFSHPAVLPLFVLLNLWVLQHVLNNSRN